MQVASRMKDAAYARCAWKVHQLGCQVCSVAAYLLFGKRCRRPTARKNYKEGILYVSKTSCRNTTLLVPPRRIQSRQTSHCLAFRYFEYILGLCSRQLLFLRYRVFPDHLSLHTPHQPKRTTRSSFTTSKESLASLFIPERQPALTHHNVVPDLFHHSHGSGHLHIHGRCIAPTARTIHHTQHPRREDASKHSSSTYRPGAQIRPTRSGYPELHVFNHQHLRRARHNWSNW